MRVNLRGADIFVTEKFLDCPNVAAALKQMRGEGMSEGVRVPVCHAELVEASLLFHTPFVRDYYVYILASKSGVLYIGVTNDLARRIFEHQHKLTAGFTNKYNVTRVVYFESFSDINEAIAREKQLKGWRRAKKIALIESSNPTWRDLSEGWRNDRDPSTSSG